MNKNNSAFKQILSWLLIVLVGISILVFLLLAKVAINWSNSLLPARTIVVNGEGEAVLIPDIVTVSFSVISEGMNVVTLQNDNNYKINKSIEFLKNQKIDSKDIKTSDYSLSPRYRYEPKTGKSSIDGYTLTQTVTVKIRDLDNVSTVLGNLPSLGINQISGPNFAVDDVKKFLDEARKEAYEDAYMKARQSASLNGVSLGRVVTFSEFGNQPPIFYARSMEAKIDSGGLMPLPPDVEPGSEEVEVNVSVTYELR